MTKNKKILVGLSTLFVPTFTTIPMVLTSCKTTEEGKKVAVQSYSDQVLKLLSGDITVGGAWSDVRQFAKKDWDKIAIIGATDPISNDGVQARENLKDDDIKGVQNLLISAIKQANADKAAKKETDLTYKDKNGKLQSMFKIYNHDGYAKIGYDATITTSDGKQKPAYAKKPETGGDYFAIDASNKVTWKGTKPFKIQFIPSSDPALVGSVTKGLQKWMNAQLNKADGEAIEISVSTNYEALGQFLKAGSQDVGFLPVGTWADKCPETKFILTSGRRVQIVDPYVAVDKTTIPAFSDEKLLVNAINNYRTFNKSKDIAELDWVYINNDKSKNPKDVAEGYPKELKDKVDELATSGNLPIVGYYRSYIYAKKGSEIEKIVSKALKEQGSNWKLKWDEVKKHIVLGFSGTTSSASYIYPEKWFAKHFEGFESFVKSLD